MFISKYLIPKQLIGRTIRTEISRLVLLSFLLIITISCQKREWDNPFDPDCSKESFTPSNFHAEQQGNVVGLSWIQANTNISGFKIERKIENSSWIEVASLEKSISTWNDISLSGGKLHEYRLYAIAGSNQSNMETTQTTPFFLPTIKTSQISNITVSSAISGGDISNDGGASITSRGVCWNTTGNPTLSDAKTSDGTGPGSFTSSLSNLSPNTTYYVRAYAINSQGTAYGEQVIFTSSSSGNQTGTFVDIRDGKNYKWVKIGSQTLMAENLAYLPAVNPSNTFSFTAYKYYVYGYEGTNVGEAKATSNYINFGVLYNWISAVQGSAGSNLIPSGVKGICPDGWHLPSIGEWNNFKQYLIDNGYGYGGSGPYIAKSLAAKTGWSASLTDGTPGFEPEKNNSSGFSALAGGIIVYHLFNWQNNSAFWWSATNYSSTPETSAVFVAVNFNTPDFPSYGTDKSDAFSVRCIKD